MFRAQETHRANHQPNAVQMSTLLSIKTGACPEDCAYCPQSVRYDTGLEREKLVPLEEVRSRALAAKEAGATRFCMGAAWRSPKKRDVEAVSAMIREVRALGMETCATLGMLTPDAGARAQGRRPRLLQPQRRHLARVLRRDHHHAHLPGSARHAGRGARRRTQRVLRRHRRHGRNGARPRLDARDAREPAPASGKRADQPAGARARHAARGHRARGSVRLRAHDCRRARRDAESVRAPVGRSRSDGRRAAGAVFPGRRELHFLRREAADHGQSRCRARSRAAHAARHRAAGAAGARRGTRSATTRRGARARPGLFARRTRARPAGSCNTTRQR